MDFRIVSPFVIMAGKGRNTLHPATEYGLENDHIYLSDFAGMEYRIDFDGQLL